MGLRKLTVIIPSELIEKATKDTGKNITDTIKEGLEMIQAKNAYLGLLKKRGKEKIILDVKSLRAEKHK